MHLFVKHFQPHSKIYLYFSLILISFSNSLLPNSQTNILTSFNYPYYFSESTDDLFDESKSIIDTNKTDFNNDLTSKQLIDKLGLGWNLGNTLDAHDGITLNYGVDSETCWGASITTEEIIKGIKSSKFKSIRIPITWHNHLIDNNYTIDPEWMERVKTVVDWCINNGLYVIINMQNDNAFHSNITYGDGFYPSKTDIKISILFIYNIWRQITLAFNNGYDEHLIFECFNRPRLSGTEKEYQYIKGDTLIEEAVSCVDEYLRLIVKTIRDSGGNNEKRFIIVTPLLSQVETALTSDFIIPGDKNYNSENNKILIGLNLFVPEFFAYEDDKLYNYYESFNVEFYGIFKSLYEKFISRNYGVIITEFGVVNKNNTEHRKNWGKKLIENARHFQVACFLWDNQDIDNTISAYDTFGYYNREKLTWENNDIINAFIKSSEYKTPINPLTKNNILIEKLISGSYNFKDDIKYFSLNIGVMSSFNSYNKLCLKVSPNSEKGESEFYFMLGDNSVYSCKDGDNISNARCDNNKIVINFDEEEESKEIEIGFNPKNLIIIKEKGINLIGYGFYLNEIYIKNAQLINIEPMIIEKSTENYQKIKLNFSDSAEIFKDNIIFSNLYNNLNVSCEIKDDKNVFICEAIFNFTGEYQILNKGDNVLLTNSVLQVISDENDIKNLIDTKILFDSEKSVINIDRSLLNNLTENSTLVIETHDLFNKQKNKTMSIYNKNGGKIIYFDEKNVNMEISNGKIIIPDSQDIQIVKIVLGKSYEDIQPSGFLLKGIGFSVNAIFIK